MSERTITWEDPRAAPCSRSPPPTGCTTRSAACTHRLVLAEGVVTHTGRRQATAEGRLTVAATGKLLATATTGCLVL